MALGCSSESSSKAIKSETKRELIRNVDKICEIYKARPEFEDVTLVSRDD